MKRPPARAGNRPIQRPAPKPVRQQVVKPTELQKKRGKVSKKRARAQFKNEQRQVRAQIKRFTVATRKRRVITMVTAGSFLSLFALLLATWFTPMLAIEKIEISGLSRLKEKTVMNSVASLKGTPLTLLDENQIRDRLKAFVLIESFSVVSNPPHTLEIHIVERQPIAIVQVGGTNYLYDPAGVQIGVAKYSDKYPKLTINSDPSKSDEFRAAIDVMLAMPVELSGEIATVSATSKDSVKLTLHGAASRSVLWGDSSQSVLKSKVLAALIKNTKANRSVVFDVSSPTAPTVRYLNF